MKACDLVFETLYLLLWIDNWEVIHVQETTGYGGMTQVCVWCLCVFVCGVCVCMCVRDVCVCGVCVFNFALVCCGRYPTCIHTALAVYHYKCDDV